ncbi:CRISPR-associated ring nuclease Csm6, partial [Accumulibacter sp.]
MFLQRENPSEYPRRILVAVTGLSPQIVTETLYALAVAPESGMAFVPTEIHLITTRSGAEKARLALLSDDPGWFHHFCRDYALPPIAFSPANIHVLQDAQGRPLDDIRSPDDNRHAADGITEIIREFTADPDSALHVSIAGGRKTMGFFLGYALSLYGRPQDQLSHVLVSEPFESSGGFYYPTPVSRVLELPGGRLVDSASAQVTLAELPFVSLRHGLPEALLTGRASYNETVEAARLGLAPPELHIDLGGRRIRAGGRAIALPPAELGLLSVFARRALNGEPPLQAPSKESPDLAWKRRYLVEMRWIDGPLG